MQLKPVLVAVLLGVSSTGFAATTSMMGNSAAVQSRLNAMQSEINQMQQIINQNNGGTTAAGGTALQSTLGTSSNWFNMISVSGLLNGDAIASTRTPVALGARVLPGQYQGLDPITSAPTTISMPRASTFGNNSATDFALANADLFVDAQVNDWTKAHVGLNYQSDDTQKLSDFDADHAPIVIRNIAGPLFDEAYVTIGNFTESPFYFRAGKQYVNFGNYDRYATVPTFTQLLSETNETAATLGFVNNGLYGSVYGFRGTPKDVDNGNTVNVNNFGVNLGFMQHNCNYGFNVQAGYLNNMNDVEYLNASNYQEAHTLNYSLDGSDLEPVFPGTYSTVGNIHDNGFLSRVGGLSLDATGNYGMFDGFIHYVTTLGGFDQGFASVENQYEVRQPQQITTERFYQSFDNNLRALAVGAGVTFDMIGHASRFGVDYQRSWNAAYVGLYGLPEHRIEGTYNMDISKNVNVGLDVYHDEDYQVVDGGSDRSSTTGVLRLGVMFA